MTRPFLFNFSSSGRGGGLKRLQEYSRWFGERGGAVFVIKSSCKDLVQRYPSNRYFMVDPGALHRLLRDGSYLQHIVETLGPLQLYYAYGVPVYRRLAEVNWFHLSNVMPFQFWRFRLPALDYLKQPLLARRYLKNLSNADIISAESSASLAFLKVDDQDKLFVSVNGGDDEIARVHSVSKNTTQGTAVVVGTYSYKAIGDSYSVFLHLQRRNPNLRLIVIGVVETIPEKIRNDPRVTCTGMLPREMVMSLLETARYYISTTRLENSYNAASEGIFLAEESFVSDIPPHRELLRDQPFELVAFPTVSRALIRVERAQVSPDVLKSWNQIVTEMLDRAGLKLD